MLAHQFRTIFVHIPKTAGQSIETVFLRELGLEWSERGALLLRPNKDPALGPDRLAHLYAREYVECGHVSQALFDSYFKFSVVRNPWARALSLYSYSYSKELSFDDFVHRVVWKRKTKGSLRHLDPQVVYLRDRAGKLLVDRVLRFEGLADEFGEVCRVTLGGRRDLPLRNKSRRMPPYQEMFDDTQRAIVAEVYREDIEAFGYAF